MNWDILPSLPVREVLPQTLKALSQGNQLILEAPPGAGKTTLVPLALYSEAWNRGRKILVLEPRRLAARTAAARMSCLLGEQPGKTVGYRIRSEHRSSRYTRIEVITEGILTRMIQQDPALQDVGCLVFDEFHERNLQADLALALALEAQSVFREDLRILVMSATLDSRALGGIMPGAAQVRSEGKQHPVATTYLDNPELPLPQAVLKATLRALREGEGGILIFLPGVGEIRRTAAVLEEALQEEDLLIMPLYGGLPWSRQQAAVAPAPEARRKIVLSTSLAETSLTIEDIRIVIDSGLMRIPRFDPGSGLDKLETLRVTRDAADQRRGRAGRLGPGLCYRLWNKVTDRALIPHRTPEILQVDLSGLALELALWGKKHTGGLALLDHPPQELFAAGRQVLRELDALDAEGAITSKGRRLAALALPPRLGHGLLEAHARGAGYTGSLLVALLSEGDIFRSGGPDLVRRMETLERYAVGVGHGAASAHACERVLKTAAQFRHRLGISSGSVDYTRLGEILALAYPDRIGRRIELSNSTPSASGNHDRYKQGIYQLVNGKQVGLEDDAFSGVYEYIVAASLGGAKGTRIFLAAPYSRQLLEEQCNHHFREEMVVEYQPEKKRVTARKRIWLGRLLLQETNAPQPEPSQKAAALLAYIRSTGLDSLPWNHASRQLLARMRFVATLPSATADWPGTGDADLMASMENWLWPWLQEGSLNFSLSAALSSRLSWQQQKLLDNLAPTGITVPSGSRLSVDYSDSTAPVLAVRLQEVYGLAETPKVGGSVPLTLHLLSPAGRPVQITGDLEGFWKKSYFEVKKDLKGRYPKHYWPDDPLHATPTRGTKKQLEREQREKKP